MIFARFDCAAAGFKLGRALQAQLLRVPFYKSITCRSDIVPARFDCGMVLDRGSKSFVLLIGLSLEGLQ